MVYNDIQFFISENFCTRDTIDTNSNLRYLIKSYAQ